MATPESTMHVFRLLTVVLGLVGLASAVRAQAPVAFERATEVEAALPQSSVYRILEDQRGFLWFATREGLGRWDGTTMRTWRRDPFDRASLPGNIVRQLVEDNSGDLWVRAEATDWTPAGIARLIGPAHDEVRRYDHVDAEVFIGPDGTPWLADSTHIWRFNQEADRFIHVRDRLRTSKAMTGLATQDGTLWIGAETGLEAYPPEGPARLVPFDVSWISPPWRENDIRTLAESPDGTLWVSGAHLGRLDASRQTLETLDLTVPDVPGHGRGFGTNALVFDAGGIWMATLDGIYHYSIASAALTRHSLRLPGDIPTQNWVTGLHRDRAGTLWAGTVWGLHRASPRTRPFHLIAHDPDDPNSLGSGIILSITRDSRGALWVGTLGGGLNQITPEGRITRYRHEPNDPRTLSHDWIWSLASDENQLWIGTGSGLNSIDLNRPSSVERIQFPDSPPVGPAGPSAVGLTLDSTGTLWFGHIGGLYRRAPDGQVRITTIEEGIQAIRTIRGGAWITTGGGLFRYDAVADSLKHYTHDPDDPTSLSDNATMALHIDKRGHFWVGTQSGLGRYNPDTDGFIHYTTADGLPGSAVYAILEDDDGRLWISTNRGLARYDEASAIRIRPYTLDDGVGNVEFNRHAAFRDADGTMYFGGDRGVTVFHPKDLVAPARRSPVVITAFHRSTRDTTFTTTYVGSEGVELAPEVTTFGFEFAALEFLDAHQVRYAVHLEGWDEGWVEIGAWQERTYTNLPPGTYTFRVRAANADGVWGDASPAIPVVIRPWFWQTAWFQALAVFALISLVALVVWDVSRRRYRRQLAHVEAQRALDAERARISRDMHDEVGASLSEIAVLSEVARRQLEAASPSHGPADERLRRIADTSRAMLESLGQIVWAINPRNDTLGALVGTLREHAARTLEAHGLDGRLRFPRSVPERAVSAEVRRSVFLIAKEALHNVVKHAGAETVTVELAVAPDHLSLTIADDGRGFASHAGDGARSAFGGNGLANMERRAQDIGGTLSIDSTGHGTTLHLEVPLSALSKSPVDVTPRRHLPA
ncbi:MAG: two-component regulator propeller domain-containing protein [Bacteroidota bacterium]